MTSYLSEYIKMITNNHELDSIVDRCKVNDTCRLKSGHEVTFVSLTADYLLEHLREKLDERISFHHWVYMPSRRAERKVGYDLSIGRYDSQRRVRSMHKLLLSWCDNRRSWTLSPSRVGDYQHLLSLYRDWSENHILPFLVIHICYCIHDYRRMGKVVKVDEDEVTLPGFESLLRTIIVPLDELFNRLSEDDFTTERNQLRVKYVKYFRRTSQKQENETVQDYWNRIALPENHFAVTQVGETPEIGLRVINLPDWRNSVVEYFQKL